jgi:hypothetical protein
MDDADRRRLIQLLGMLGSAHDGEILNAAKLAQRQLGTLGVTWEELLNGIQTTVSLEDAYRQGHSDGFRKAQAQAAKTSARQLTWATLARQMLDCDDDLTEWETGFLQNYVDRGWPSPTIKQRAVMERLAQKLGFDTPEWA